MTEACKKRLEFVQAGLPSDVPCKNLGAWVFRGSNETERPRMPPALPHIVELVNRAESWAGMLVSGEERNRAGIADRFRCTRARVTQVMKLLELHPLVLEYVKNLPPGTPTNRVTERGLRVVFERSLSEQLPVARASVRGFIDYERARLRRDPRLPLP